MLKVYLLFFFLEATIGFWALDCSPDYLSKADQIVPNNMGLDISTLVSIPILTANSLTKQIRKYHDSQVDILYSPRNACKAEERKRIRN